MASKSVKCSYCRLQILVPPYAHAIQCAACQTIIHVQPIDQTRNSFKKRFKDMLYTASSNIKASIKNYTGLGISDSVNYPQQATSSLPVFPVPVHGRKRAVLCGVSYYGQRYKLDGTVNDVKSMRYFLTQRLGFL